jgi:hypothetical protein
MGGSPWFPRWSRAGRTRRQKNAASGARRGPTPSGRGSNGCPTPPRRSSSPGPGGSGAGSVRQCDAERPGDRHCDRARYRGGGGRATEPPDRHRLARFEHASPECAAPGLRCGADRRSRGPRRRAGRAGCAAVRPRAVARDRRGRAAVSALLVDAVGRYTRRVRWPSPERLDTAVPPGRLSGRGSPRSHRAIGGRADPAAVPTVRR